MGQIQSWRTPGETYVAIFSELISNELNIDELVSDDICNEEKTLLGRLVFWIREVSLDVSNRLHLAGGGAFMLDTGIAAATWLMGGHVCDWSML